MWATQAIMGAMGVMGWVRVRAAKGIMNSEFWIGHKLQACTSGGNGKIIVVIKNEYIEITYSV